MRTFERVEGHVGCVVQLDRIEQFQVKPIGIGSNCVDVKLAPQIEVRTAAGDLEIQICECHLSVGSAFGQLGHGHQCNCGGPRSSCGADHGGDARLLSGGRAINPGQCGQEFCVVKRLLQPVARLEPDHLDAITYLEQWSDQLERLGMETGPLAVWLWNALVARGLPIICLDARHANGVLKMMPNKTDRHDARGLAQIVRTGWYKAVQIKSHGAYVTRALLTARDALVGMRVRLENEVRGLLKTFGVMFGKRVGGFKRRAEELSLATSPLRLSWCRSSKPLSRLGATSSLGSRHWIARSGPSSVVTSRCGC